MSGQFAIIKPVFALSVAVSLVLLTGCASGPSGGPSKPSKVIVQGVEVTTDSSIAKLLPEKYKEGIRAVTAAPFPPFEMFDENQNLYGLDIDLGNALAAKLGTSIQFTSIDYNGIIPAIQANTYDAVFAGMGDTVEREEVLNFVIHSTQGYVLIVRKGNPNNITGINELCGHTLAIEKGTQTDDYFDVLQENCKIAGEQGIRVNQLPKSSDGLLAMKSGNADALYLGISTAVEIVKTADEGTSLEIVAPEGKPFGWDPQNVGIGLPKSDPELLIAMEAGMIALQKDGTLKKLFDAYGLGDVAAEKILVNTPLNEPLS